MQLIHLLDRLITILNNDSKKIWIKQTKRAILFEIANIVYQPFSFNKKDIEIAFNGNKKNFFFITTLPLSNKYDYENEVAIVKNILSDLKDYLDKNFHGKSNLKNQLLSVMANIQQDLQKDYKKYLDKINKKSFLLNPNNKDMVTYIFSFFSAYELNNIKLVSTKMKELANQDELWRELLQNKYPQALKKPQETNQQALIRLEKELIYFVVLYVDDIDRVDELLTYANNMAKLMGTVNYNRGGNVDFVENDLYLLKSSKKEMINYINKFVNKEKNKIRDSFFQTEVPNALYFGMKLLRKEFEQLYKKNKWNEIVATIKQMGIISVDYFSPQKIKINDETFFVKYENYQFSLLQSKENAATKKVALKSK